LAKRKGKQEKDGDFDVDIKQVEQEIKVEQERKEKKKKYPWSPLTDNETFKRFRRGVFRFCVYGAIMLMVEIFFYNITRIGREIPVVEIFFRFKWLVDVGPNVNLNDMWDVPIITFYGQASLWMFLVYGFIVFFGVEWAYRNFRDKMPWFVRGLIYMVIILTLECATGWVLYWITGYEIWYYGGQFAILRYTSLAIAPIWFISGLMAENFFHIIFKLSRLKDITKL
jgi:hypothetical protein